MSKRLQIVLIVLFLLSPLVFTQDKQVDVDKQLREEILSIYKSVGEQGLLDFVKKDQNKISNQFIIDFAEAGVKERKEEWLKTCEIMAEEKKEKKTLADVLYHTGEYFRLISNNKKATNYFDKALPIYIKLNDLAGQGNVYLSNGIIYNRIGDNSKALALYKRAMHFFESVGDTQGMGNVYLRKGMIYFQTGERARSLEMYEKALLFFEKAEDPVGQGNIYFTRGNIYLRAGNNKRALEVYDKALSLFQKASYSIGKGNVYLRKGIMYLRIGEISIALHMLDEALVNFQKERELIGQGNVYQYKGDSYYYRGDNARAIEMYDAALPFYERSGDNVGQGYIYLKKGNVYYHIGDNSRAIEMYNSCLPFFEKVGAIIGQGNVYLRKGIVYQGVGDKSKAVEMYNKALPFFKKAEDPIGQGNVYVTKGNIYYYDGDISKAISMYDKALVLFEGAGDIIGQGNSYQKKGCGYLSAGENLKALKFFDKALYFFKKAREPIGEGGVYQNRGEVYSIIGNNSIAIEMYDKALSLFKKAGAIKSEYIVLHLKAKDLVKLGRKIEALGIFEKVLAKTEKLRTQTAFSELKKTFMEKVYEQYEDTVVFMLENKYYERGLKYLESIRARGFLDQMAEGLVRLDKGLIPDMIERRNNLITKLSMASKEIYKTGEGNNEKKLQDLKKNYRRLENQFEDLLIKIRLDNPLYASVRYPEPITVALLQKDVLKKREFLLEYFITPDRLYVFLVSKDDFKVIPLTVNGKEIERDANRYLSAIKENNSKNMKKYGKRLYQMLFKPLEIELKNNRDIIIVPDGELARIPFESLVFDDNRYLMDKYTVKYIQSASVLSLLRKHYQRDSETKSFIGFGDPVYDYENFNLGKPELGAGTLSREEKDEIKEMFRSRYARAGGIMNRIQAGGDEIKTIAGLFENASQKNVVRLREQATEDNAKASEMKDFDFIHFACHGLLNDDFQSLVLSQLPPDKSREDGYFTLNEIMNCDYNAKLVVLSACQTGTGKMERAEGVMGLTRAVMYAGTPAVVASLWDVDDRATRELMVRFYRNMLEKNMDKAEALRQAKLELIKIKKYASPLFWSAFVMYGE